MPDTADPPQPVAAPAVEYEHPAGAFPRRQFRLLILTFINTLLLAAFVCGPAISTFARSAWIDWQASRVLKQQLQQQAAMLRQAEQFSAPAGQIVYEEHPLEAARLAKTSAFGTINVRPIETVHITPQPWQPPVYHKMPPAVAQFRAAISNSPPSPAGTLLLHALEAPDGQKRLVWVLIAGDQTMAYPPLAERVHTSQRRLSVGTKRQIVAHVFDVSSDQLAPKMRLLDTPHPVTRLVPETPGRQAEVLWTKTDSWENGQVEIRPAGFFRFYAAQLDPTDPSHFTIDYALDGQRGTIDGYLKPDDQLDLIPRTGRIVGRTSNGDFVWNPFAAPATQRAKP